jgi:DNA-binding NtrC family response regulator
VWGESGTGKELVARAIHRHSDRVQGPFVAVNCKAFAGGVLESELFGHERGAYTGAAQARAGVFERADGGTLLLDEIGEVDLEFQAKLLRVLQTREVLPVGGARPKQVDVRVVAATNRDLRAEVAAGRFREDLYFRLAVIPIRLPPLRERPEDILPLAGHFLARWARELGRSIRGWTPEVEAWLLAHPWPGNVRELENLVERAAVLARDEEITLADLLIEDAPAATPGDELPLQAYLDRAAERRIRGALARCQGRRAEAARALGVERTTLYRLMKKFGIDAE